ncbi:hypothetical protein FRB91_011457 [Serendipita sp. 411]|nr:hypothetical protein FRC18_010297 [Serendipita sp. 400]KAG8857362.1 hypothetical protein FRB91_011457 [Serendipita sp. 411]
MIFSRILALAAFSGLCAAHFELTYPPTRGFEHDIEAQAPCGGFNNVTTRTPFPLGDAHITISSGHPANFLVLISFANNPTDIANWTAQTPLKDWVRTAEKDVCFEVDIASGGYTAATEGVNATILVQYVGGDTPLFQCSDVVLTSNATIPSNVTCANPVQATGTSTGTGTTSPSATSTPNSARTLTYSVGTALLSVVGLAYSLL